MSVRATPASLLMQMSEADMQRFYGDLMVNVQRSLSGPDTAEGFEVVHSIGNKGKGLVAKRSFAKDEEIFRERPFVGIQSNANRAKALVCANCFRFVGSVELQLAWQLLEKAENETLSPVTASQDHSIATKLALGELQMPFPHISQLPRLLFCPAGCSEVYCCSRCCADSWQRHHCLLCPGADRSARFVWLRELQHKCPYIQTFQPSSLCKFSHDAQVFGWLTEAISSEAANCGLAEHNSRSTAGAASSSRSYDEPTRFVGPLPMPPWLDMTVDRAACTRLQVFAMVQDLDTVELQAQIVAQVVCTAMHCAWVLQFGDDRTALATAVQACALQHAQRVLNHRGRGQVPQADVLCACLEGAWLPLQAAMKVPYDECNVPQDVMDASAYRQQLRVLVSECAELNRRIMFSPAFEALFSDEVVSSLLGMFQLNCLGITVESPVEHLCDEIQTRLAKTDEASPANAQEMRQAQDIMQLLGDVDVPCDGSAFYVIQSCLNHENQPNCTCEKDIEDRDASAALVALKQVAAGDELTITYVGTVDEMASGELQEALADFGIHLA